MLQLPNSFKNKIINRYGQMGKEWLEHVDDIMNQYKTQFDLRDIKLIENLSMNVVAFANCDWYGDVVIKIGAPGPSSLYEINVMKYYSSDYVPKTYYSSVNDRFQLLERISPGYSLKSVPNRQERIEIFSDLSAHLFIPANEKQNFKTFQELLKEKVDYAYENKSTFSATWEMIDFAKKLYDKLQNMNLPKYILHNDLHHGNILKTQSGWKAIDPHGIVGEKVFETCNFIRSELEFSDLEDDKIAEIISLVSQYFKEDEILILQALYIYIIEKIIFYTKNNYDSARITHNIDICQKLLQILSCKNGV